MAFISSMAKREKFERFKEHLENGNVKGVKANLEPEYMEQIVDDFLKMSPLHLACYKGYFEIASLLIKKKCNIESQSILGRRAIHWACLNGHIKIVKLLIEKKCDIESEDKDGRRPIHLACGRGNFEITNLLIEKKCNIERETKEGMRPIHFACENGSKEIVKLLIDHNCLIDASNKHRETPLDMAKSRGRGEIVKLLSDKVKKSQIDDTISKMTIKALPSLVREEIEKFQKNQSNFTNPVREKIIEREKVVVVKEVKIERITCGICLEREVDSVFECGHTICEVCSDEIYSSEISRCPFCNFESARPKRIYFN